mgnify:CR=1 FL=1
MLPDFGINGAAIRLLQPENIQSEYFKLKGDVRALVKTLNIDKGVKDD